MDPNVSAKTIDRRDFLKTTAAAGLAVGSGSLASAAGGTNDLRVALIGAGNQGMVLLESCQKIPNIRITALCDIWQEYRQRYASGRLRTYGHAHNTYVDIHEMLDKEKGRLDAAIVATPDFWHAEHAVACLNAGLHVYCEKEMSNTLEDARRIARAARESRKLLQVGHQRRSNPRYLFSFQKLLREASLLGRMTTVSGQWNRSRQDPLTMPAKYAIPPATLEKYGFRSMEQFLNWRWYRGLGGGPVVDLGSHQIDIFNWFLGVRPASVMASGGTDYYSKDTHEWYDTVMAVFEYPMPAGTVRAFYQTITTNGFGGYYELFLGDQGSLEISESGARAKVYRDVANAPDWGSLVKRGLLVAPKDEPKPQTQPAAVLDVRETVPPPSYALPVQSMKLYHQPHLENFFDAIRGKGRLTCPSEVGYESAVTVLKVNEAIEAGHPVRFTPADFEI
ncbi:MAG: Gfo/Idh/MocA family oxidoreductase [Planctomycetes bacterium]|nr:Gfo/Idh/MocA family oxidoreductase [Planctomycetota bacterium]